MSWNWLTENFEYEMKIERSTGAGVTCKLVGHEKLLLLNIGERTPRMPNNNDRNAIFVLAQHSFCLILALFFAIKNKDRELK